jgi:UDP-N-acetyl-D-mannosaminuronic acid dehydrogenase
MPQFVLERIYNIMKEKGMTKLDRIGLYGLTYKENVDDYRESPTLQLLECQEKHLAEPLKVYDPFIEKNIVKNQYHDFDAFLQDVDFVVIMVGHDEIKNNMEKLKGKIILDTKKVCFLEKTYYL